VREGAELRFGWTASNPGQGASGQLGALYDFPAHRFAPCACHRVRQVQEHRGPAARQRGCLRGIADVLEPRPFDSIFVALARSAHQNGREADAGGRGAPLHRRGQPASAARRPPSGKRGALARSLVCIRLCPRRRREQQHPRQRLEQRHRQEERSCSCVKRRMSLPRQPCLPSPGTSAPEDDETDRCATISVRFGLKMPSHLLPGACCTTACLRHRGGPDRLAWRHIAANAALPDG
jgi:hypothetical protein